MVPICNECMYLRMYVCHVDSELIVLSVDVLYIAYCSLLILFTVLFAYVCIYGSILDHSYENLRRQMTVERRLTSPPSFK